jgi:hypothetical protein
MHKSESAKCSVGVEADVSFGFPQSFRSFVGHEGKVDSSDSGMTEGQMYVGRRNASSYLYHWAVCVPAGSQVGFAHEKEDISSHYSHRQLSRPYHRPSL